MCSPGLCDSIAAPGARARLRQCLAGPHSTASNREAHAFAADATSTGPTVDGDRARLIEKLYTETFGSGRPATNRVQELFGPLGADGPDYFAASIKFQMWLSVSSLVSFGSQILLRDAAALSAGTAGALDRVPLEMGNRGGGWGVRAG